MMDILKKIIATKHEELATLQAREPFAQLSEQLSHLPPRKGFITALQQRILAKQSAVIAEIKKASPSKGVIRPDFAPNNIARQYEQHGATCLSVLTDEQYFHGHPDFLRTARAVTELPILRKDFIIDEYQIAEAKIWGADCILLIVAALSDVQLQRLYNYALTLDLDVLVEVHDSDELERALALGLQLIGINNRNLKTFETHLDTTISLLEKIPDEVIIITESGIHQREDIAKMHTHGVYGFLVGEAFMRAENPGEALAALFGTAVSRP